MNACTRNAKRCKIRLFFLILFDWSNNQFSLFCNKQTKNNGERESKKKTREKERLTPRRKINATSTRESLCVCMRARMGRWLLRALRTKTNRNRFAPPPIRRYNWGVPLVGKKKKNNCALRRTFLPLLPATCAAASSRICRAATVVFLGAMF